MKIIAADIYELLVVNSRYAKFPKEFRSYKIVWNMRDVLFELWSGEVTDIAIPEKGTPGYDFPNFVQDMMQIGQIKSRPNFKYYNLNIIKKS